MDWGTARILRNRDAGLYLTGVLVAGFGSAAMSLAAGVWVKTLTGSDSLAALTTFCVWLPVLFGPAIGVLADRTRRRPLLIVTNAAMALLLLVLLTIDSAARIWLLFAVLLIYGTAFVLTDAAEAAVVPAVVPGDLLGDFNGLRMTVNEGMKLAAPLAGAGLFVAFGSAPVILLNAATFALAAGAFSLLRVREEPPARRRAPWRRQIAEGLGYLRRQPDLRHLVSASALAMLLSGITGAMTFAVVDHGLGLAPGFVGVLAAVQGAGSVVGGLAAGPLLRRLPAHIFAAAGLLLFAIGLGLRAAPWTGAVIGSSMAIGLGLPAVLIATMTTVQRLTPAGLLGRVSATANTLSFAPVTAGVAVGAGLVAYVDYRIPMAGAALAAGVLAAHCRRGGAN